MQQIAGRILTAEGWLQGRLTVEDGRIRSVEAIGGAASGGPTILPGFVDLHCHGGGGADVMEAGEAATVIARTHAASGTTSMLATTMTATVEDIEAALVAAADAGKNRRPGTARILGVHLEGPFISADRLGAQPNCPLKADIALIDRLCTLAPIRVLTWAPEADPDGSMAEHLNERGIRVQIGHSSCDYETAAARLTGPISGVTHMFNAMSPLHHRAPGIVGAALAHARHAEIIPDLLHVHPGAIHCALRAIPNLYAVTDATAASGMPDGDYRLGTQTVRKCGNGVRLADGTLAGSSLTLLDGFRNLVSIGLSLEEASRRTSTIAADYLGLGDRGRIAPGAWADLVLVDDDLTLLDVYVEGERIAR